MEIKLILFGLVFFLAFGIITNVITGSTPADEREAILADVTEDMGFISASVITLGSGLFGLFGIDVFKGLVGMPVWLTTLITAFAILVILTFLLWFAEKIGQVIPLT